MVTHYGLHLLGHLSARLADSAAFSVETVRFQSRSVNLGLEETRIPEAGTVCEVCKEGVQKQQSFSTSDLCFELAKMFIGWLGIKNWQAGAKTK